MTARIHEQLMGPVAHCDACNASCAGYRPRVEDWAASHTCNGSAAARMTRNPPAEVEFEESHE